MKPIILILLTFNSSFASNEIKNLIKKHALKESTISFVAVNTITGKDMASYNPDLPGPLASVTKMLSLYYALSTLGANKRFKTSLYYSGKIEDQILKGDIFLKGEGDPYLTPSQLMNLAYSLKDLGIKGHEGKFYFDDTLLAKSPRLSNIGLEDQPDNPSIGALSVDFNRFRVFRNKELLPQLGHIKLKASQEQLDVDLNFKYLPKEKAWITSEKAKKKYIHDLPSRDAGLFTASYFRYLASLIGVKVTPPSPGVVPKTARLVEEHNGLSLWRLSSLAIEYSNNLMAELPSMVATQAISKKASSIADAAESLKIFLQKNFPEAGFNEASFENSSGLTSNNLASPRVLTNFLNKVKNKKFESRSFWSLFSINGRSGWISKRLIRPELAYRVWAKTGSLHYVNNIAGYYLNSKGERVAFAILIHDKKMLELLKNPLSKKAEIARRGAKAWSRKSKSFTDALLLSWLK